MMFLQNVGSHKKSWLLSLGTSLVSEKIAKIIVNSLQYLYRGESLPSEKLLFFLPNIFKIFSTKEDHSIPDAA